MHCRELSLPFFYQFVDRCSYFGVTRNSVADYKIYTLVRIRESSAGYTPTPSDSTKGLALFLFESRVSALNP